MKIGFIGLGIMGSRMAANLRKRGHSLVVFNRTREKAEPLLAEGASWADSHPAGMRGQPTPAQAGHDRPRRRAGAKLRA